MAKADVQHMFDRPQTACFHQPKVQIQSCASQNDFPIPQHVKMSFTMFPVQLQLFP